MLARLRAATKSSTNKDGAPEDAKPHAKGIFTKMFGAKPKGQWDVNSTYLNLTRVHVLARTYEHKEEATARYGILFRPNNVRYIKDNRTYFAVDQSYTQISCLLCPDTIDKKVAFHTNVKPTNIAEWTKRDLTSAEFTKVQWITLPNEYFRSVFDAQKPILVTAIAENHPAADKVVFTEATNPVNPYFVEHDNLVEPVSRETVPPLPATPAPPAPAVPVSTKPVSIKPPARPARPRVTKLHLFIRLGWHIYLYVYIFICIYLHIYIYMYIYILTHLKRGQGDP